MKPMRPDRRLRKQRHPLDPILCEGPMRARVLAEPGVGEMGGEVAEAAVVAVEVVGDVG